MTSPGDLNPDLRHVDELDQPHLVAVVDDWFGGRRVRHLATRSWFRHFASTSWLATSADGHRIGFLVGYRSQDRAGEAVLHLVAVDPNHRRRGVGRALVTAFLDGVAATGTQSVDAVAWPDDPVALAFFVAVGFRADDGPGSRHIFGATGFPDYDAEGEDRVRFVRRLTSPG